MRWRGLRRPKFQRTAILETNAEGAVSILRKAVAFFTQQRVGLLAAGGASGTGFVIHRISEQSSASGRGRGSRGRAPSAGGGERRGGSWSAPSYFKVRYWGVGPVLGYEYLQSCMCIADDKGLASFTTSGALLGLDATLEAGSGMSRRARTQQLRADTATRTFTIASGILIGTVLRAGVLSVDQETNEALFGEGVTPEQLLAGAERGGVQPPEEFGELYELLNLLSQE
eukprot:scaffold2.g7255.t1